MRNVLRHFILPALIAQVVAAPLAAQSLDGLMRSRFRAAAGVGYTSFPSFEGRVGDQRELSSASADRSVVGYGASLEYFPTPRPVFVGLAANFTRNDFSQSYTSSDPLVPRVTTGTVRGQFWNMYLGYVPLRLRRASAYGYGGLVLALNDLESVAEYDFGPEVAQTRRYTGWLGTLGAGADLGFYGPLGGRVGAQYSTSAKRPNADTNWRLSFSTTLNF
jgi:hypothetical protein